MSSAKYCPATQSWDHPLPMRRVAVWGVRRREKGVNVPAVECTQEQADCSPPSSVSLALLVWAKCGG